MLRSSLSTADSWNTWFDWFGNDAHGFSRLNEHVSSIIAESGRNPAEVRRSACLLVRVDESSSERPDPVGARAIDLGDLGSVLHDMVGAGADEVIIVADPISESSMRCLDEVISEFRSSAL